MTTAHTVTPPPTSSLRRWASRHHPVVWWIVVVKICFTLAFSLLVPFFRGPDEVLHLSMLRWYGTNIGYTDPTVKLPVDPALLAIGVDPPRGPGEAARPPLQAADAPARPDRPTLAELDAATTGVVNEPTNQLSQHPAMFYVSTNAVTGVLTGVVPSSWWSWDRQALTYRWQSVLVSGLMPLVASAGALAAGLRRGPAAVAAAFVFCVPMHSFIGSVINSDSLVVLLSGVAVTATIAYVARGARRRWAIAAALAVAAAVAMKSTAVPVLPWVVASVALPVWWAWRQRTAVAKRLVTLAWVVAIGLIGSSWQLANLVRFGKLQPSAYRLDVREEVATSLGEFATTWPARLSVSFWGQPGRRTGVGLSEVVTTVLSAATLAAMVAGVVLAWRRGSGRVVPTLLAGLCALQVALVLRTNWAGYFRGSGLEGFQGRYFFIVLVPMAVLVALGVDAAVTRWVRPGGAITAVRVAVAMAGVGWLVHAALGERMLVRYWGTAGSGWGVRLDAVTAWSPLPVTATVVVLVSPALVAVAAIATWLVRRRPGPHQVSAAGRRTPTPATPR